MKKADKVHSHNEESDFAAAGVYDAPDLQKKITEQCKEMEPVVRALFSVYEVDGKTIISAEIPGMDISEHPVFYKGAVQNKRLLHPCGRI